MYCPKCGKELNDNESFCSNCGQQLNNNAEASQNYYQPNNSQGYYQPNNSQNYYQPSYQQNTSVPGQDSGIVTAIKVFLILGTIAMASCTFLVGLAWCLPMTIYYFNSIKERRPIGIGFKICTLLFVNLIGGILMLCDNEH